MSNTINLNWTANNATPFYDSANKGGGREPAGTYVITGTGFGTKTGTPYYDDFETEAAGAVAGTPISGAVGSLVVSQVQGVYISDAVSYSGTKSIYKDYSDGDFPKIYKSLSGLNRRAYMAGWFKFNGAGGVVWKHGRIGAGSSYTGDPKAGSSYTAPSTSTAPQSFSGEMKTKNPAEFTGFSANNTGAFANSPNAAYLTDTWLFYEFEFDAGTLNTSNSYVSERLSNKETLLWDGLRFLDSTAPDLPDWILTVINGHDGVNTLNMYMDSIYIDESRARVVMTDNAIYANSTQWAVQPISTYSDTEVTVTKARQGFAIGESAFLHLFNNDGVLVSEGNAVTVEAD